MGFYAPAQLVRDARNHGVEIYPADVNHSRWDCTLEGDAMRLGLRMIRGLGQSTAEIIEQAREAGDFRSLDDFAKRTKLEQAILTRLSNADAFRSLALDRRQSLWQSLGRCREHRPLFDELDEDEPLMPLVAMSEREEVSADYRTLSLSLKAHPISFYRAQLDSLQVTPAARLLGMKDGQFARVAGLVLMRQRPGTARGITFVTIEDETGQVNLIIKPDVWERFYKVAHTASAFIAHGRLQKHGDPGHEIIHIVVSKLENMALTLHTRSRDFH
jgi:error-prone DNA polymerase